MGARKNRDARETHKGRGSSLPPCLSPSPMFPSCTPFFLTYYFPAPAKQARIHCVRIKLYSWFSQSEMDVTFFMAAKPTPWLLIVLVFRQIFVLCLLKIKDKQDNQELSVIKHSTLALFPLTYSSSQFLPKWLSMKVIFKNYLYYCWSSHVSHI